MPVPVGTSMPPPSVTVMLPLTDPNLSTLGVGSYPLTWLWQYQPAPGAPWVDMGPPSRHMVYVTLDSPGAPWSQGTAASDALRWPWTRVLDKSCQWAQGVRILGGDLDAAIRKATRQIESAIYALGARADNPVEYADDGSGVHALSSTRRRWHFSVRISCAC